MVAVIREGRPEEKIMADTPYKTALIVGVGSGLSASVARAFKKAEMTIALAARRAGDLAALAQGTGGQAFACDATKEAEVAQLSTEVEAAFGVPEVVVYNASYRTRGPFVDLDPAEVQRSLIVTAFGGFLIAREAAKRMLPMKRGAILSTVASPSVKGYPQSAPFAMGKFALRGLAQSMARELQPQGIHVAHIVVDGGILSPRRPNPPDKPDAMLDPDAIAQSYLDLLRQHRSAWAWEIELRPWLEKF